MSLGIINPVICTNLSQGYTTTITSGGITSLTSASNQQQYFTGTSTHTVRLPVTSTLDLGISYLLVNNSTQPISVQTSSGTVILSIGPGIFNIFTCILTSGTTAASWSIDGSTSLTGTSNQIVVNPFNGNATLSLPSTVNATMWTLSGLTPSQAVITDGSKMLTSIPYTSTATPTSFVFRDSNINTTLNNSLTGYTTTVTSAGTTTLTVASTQLQYFTGTAPQTILLPVTSTLILGQSFTIVNNSTDLLTVFSSGSNVVSIINPGLSNTLTCVLTSGTTAASWKGNNVLTSAPTTTPTEICFDGTYVWTTEPSSNVVVRFNAETLLSGGGFATGVSPLGVCTNGTYVWVSNTTGRTVTQFLASTGALVATSISVGVGLGRICFDGTFLWVTQPGFHRILKYTSNPPNYTGLLYSTGSNPDGICFDGTHIWTANTSSANVTKLLAATGALIGTYAVGTSPRGICFDGIHIWTANSGSANVTKLIADTGALVGTYSVGTTPINVCFDGTNVWITNSGSSNVTKLLAATGALVGTYRAGNTPRGICFDGTGIFVCNSANTNPSGNTVMKITQPNNQLSTTSAPIGIPLLSTYNNISRDANANTRINNAILGYSTTASGTTTALSVLSPRQIYFTTTQTVILPDVTTLTLGHSFKIVNRSGGTVTVNTFGGDLLKSMPTLTYGVAVCIQITGTAASSWSFEDGGGTVL